MFLKVTMSFYFFAQFINSKLSNTRSTSPSIVLAANENAYMPVVTFGPSRNKRAMLL